MCGLTALLVSPLDDASAKAAFCSCTLQPLHTYPAVLMSAVPAACPDLGLPNTLPCHSVAFGPICKCHAVLVPMQKSYAFSPANLSVLATTLSHDVTPLLAYRAVAGYVQTATRWSCLVLLGSMIQFEWHNEACAHHSATPPGPK